MYVIGFLFDVVVVLDVKFCWEWCKGYNVVGVFGDIECEDKDFVMFGVYYDYIGIGKSGNLWGINFEVIDIYYGVDDNVFGVVVVLDVGC